MTIAPISCGMNAKNALNPSCRDSTTRFSFLQPCLTLRVRPPPADAGPACAPEGPTDEREEQREDARDREDGPQSLLRDVLRDVAGRRGQRNAAELVHEAEPHGAAYERQDYRDDQGEQGYEEPVLDP